MPGRVEVVKCNDHQTEKIKKRDKTNDKDILLVPTVIGPKTGHDSKIWKENVVGNLFCSTALFCKKSANFDQK
jgi:hypothetical protein